MLIKRVVVADDEKIQLDGLAAVLQRLLPGAEVVPCMDGQEAYEAVGKGETQLLLTDICMPVLDGIGLIEKVSVEYPRVKIVLISAWQEFEYARSAIRFGVSEYLLKPLRVEDARKLVNKISAVLKEEQERERKQDHYDAMLEQLKENERQNQLKKLIEGTGDADAFEKEFPELKSPGVAVMIRWKVLDGRTHRYQEEPDRAQREAVWEELRRAQRCSSSGEEGLLTEMERGLNRQERRCAMLLPGTDEEKALLRMTSVVSELKKQGIVFWAGISVWQEELFGTLPEAVRQADEALAFCFYTPVEGRIFAWRGLDAVLEEPFPSLSLSEKKLREAVRRGEQKEIGVILSRIRDVLEKGKLYYPGRVKCRISSIVGAIVREVEGMIPQKEYELLLNETYERYALCDCLEQLFSVSQSLLEETARYFTQAPEAYDAVEICVAWMRQHPGEDISLQMLADMVHFHPNYLSAQISKRLGVSFSSYLLSLRMDMARRMLRETDCQVQDVARRCGFRDSSYFNRMFRREYGMSPEQFRKVQTSCR